jgi:hypothetical protein
MERPRCYVARPVRRDPPRLRATEPNVPSASLPKLAEQPRPRCPARNPARASRSGSVKAGWIVARAVDGAAVVIEHLRAGLRPGGLGQLRVPAIERKPNVNRPSWSRHVTTSWKSSEASTARNAPPCRIGAPAARASLAFGGGQIIRFRAFPQQHLQDHLWSAAVLQTAYSAPSSGCAPWDGPAGSLNRSRR